MRKQHDPGALKKREGFAGQKMIVLPRKIAADFLSRDPITKQIYITDIGYYPKAKFHYVQRSHGVNQHILIYCVEGSGWVEIDDVRTKVSPSQCFVIPAGTAHKYGADEKDPWTIYWFHFRGDISAHVAGLIQAKTGKLRPVLGFNENRIKLFEEIYTNLEMGYNMDNLRYINMIFYHFLSSLLYEEKFNNADKRTETDFVTSSIEFMQKNIGAVLTLGEMAAFAKLSVSHFSSMFRSKTGYSPIEYFNHLKVQKACQYLIFSDMPVKEMASLLGVDDPYYFSRMFSRVMEVSPSEYRRLNNSSKES